MARQMLPCPDQGMLPLLREIPGGRRHDLPPSWDGRAITWDPWGDEPANFACRGRRSHDLTPTCPACRRTGWRLMCHGRTQVDPTVSVHRLIAYRCRHCGHDTVTSISADGMQDWDLDDSDYQDTGSWNRAPRHDH